MERDHRDSYPNLPEPANGLIKAYDFSHRTFTRPFSAKTIYFYKDGDTHFQGLRVPVSKARYRTMDALKTDLNDRLQLDFGVRRVFTPHGRTEVDDLSTLKHMGKYVCSSSKWARRFNMDAVSRHQRKTQEALEKERNHRRIRSHNDSLFASSNAAISEKERHKPLRLYTPPTNSHMPKQILFVLNGQPSRVYRAMFRPNRPLPQLDQLLTEVSEGFSVPIYKLFTFDGKRVVSTDDVLKEDGANIVACQRHERPQLDATTAPIAKFPPINRFPNRVVANGDARGLNHHPPQPPPPPHAPITRRPHKADEGSNKSSKQSSVRIAHPLPPIPAHRGGAIRFQPRRHVAVAHAAAASTTTSKPPLPALPAAAGDKERRQATLQRKNTEHLTEERSKRMAKARRVVSTKKTRRPKKTNEEAEKQPKEAAKESAAEEPTAEEVKAATRIQAGVRGHRARSQYKDELSQLKKAQQMEKRASAAKARGSKSDVNAEEQAAVQIQAAFRGYTTRKSLDKMSTSQTPTEMVVATETGDESFDRAAPQTVIYNVSIFTGNRWSADLDADLYIIFNGQNGSSQKHWLKQTDSEPKFSQNQLDNFDVSAAYVGSLKSVEVGHESEGYGAGTYLERVIVMDTVADNRQYLFNASVWLDSGQVDGETRRVLPCIGYFDLNSLRDIDMDEEAEIAPSKGRWSITLHSGGDGQKGTTAHLSIVGYGSAGNSEAIPLTDAGLSQSEDSFTTFEEVGFGQVGDLYKVRLMAEPAGAQPDYHLASIELKDLDTGESMRLLADKCLTQGRKGVKPRPFVELPTVRVGVEPLCLCNYTGKITAARLGGAKVPNGTIEMQLIGEFGETGYFPVALPTQNGGPKADTHELEFGFEGASLGRMMSVNVLIPIDHTGEDILAGFNALQEIFEKNNLSFNAAAEWIIESVMVRESLHAPYQFVFADSRLAPAGGAPAGYVKKSLEITEMQGLSTQLADRVAATGEWIVSLTTGDTAQAGTLLQPSIALYGSQAHTHNMPLTDQQLIPATTTHFHVSTSGLGELYKVRIALEDSSSTTTASSEDAEDAVTLSWYLKKLKLKDSCTGAELRFPVEAWLERNSVVELPAVWPDLPPLPLILYQITVVTGTDSGNENDFTVCIKVEGEKGDTGTRLLTEAIGTTHGSTFKPGNSDVFDIEAVTVQEISQITVGISHSDQAKSWFLDRVQILDPEANRFYIFVAKQLLSTENSDEAKSESTLQVTEIIEDAV